MKLLIISGTPKTDGLTFSFVKKAEETAKEIKAKSEVIRLSGTNLTKCKMCADGWGICFSKHHCEFGDADGFNDLQKKVKNADAYIFITPVYWGEISEDMKVFMDKLRRCQATKQWNKRDDIVSFLKGKPSIMVAVAGGGGGGIVTTFADIERAIGQMGGDEWPKEHTGIFDYIAVNRWNQEYKREALGSAIKTMVSYKKRPIATNVMPQSDYQLLISFDNNVVLTYDMKPYLATKPYDALLEMNLFSEAKVSGTKIEWRPGVDIDISDVLSANESI